MLQYLWLVVPVVFGNVDKPFVHCVSVTFLGNSLEIIEPVRVIERGVFFCEHIDSSYGYILLILPFFILCFLFSPLGLLLIWLKHFIVSFSIDAIIFVMNRMKLFVPFEKRVTIIFFIYFTALCDFHLFLRTLSLKMYWSRLLNMHYENVWALQSMFSSMRWKNMIYYYAIW